MADQDVTMKELQNTLDQLDDESKLLDVKIESLQNQKEDIEQQRIQILTQMESLVKSSKPNNSRNRNYNNSHSNSNTSFQNDLRLIQFKGEFKWDKSVEYSLKKKFNLSTFRPMQREIINCTLKQKDCFVILPSGGGKSLCYQLPATLKKPYTNQGITLVVSPLVALMIDQCYQLNKIGIKAGSFHGNDNSRDEHKKIYDDLQSLDNVHSDPEYKLIYVTPEKVVKSKTLHNKLEIAHNNNKFDRIVIDEAHCCSQWGHDFRTSYKSLNLLRRQYKNVPILACTATATDQVLNDTIKILRMKDVMVFRGSFNRPNLHYAVRPKPNTKKDAYSELLTIVKDEFKDESGIIYVLSRKECVDIFEYLQDNGVAALPYHGDMNNDLREKTQTKWLDDKCQVVVATLAFGLGINKPDVSFVIHYTISQSIQNYYQESGRAGRDGEKSHCILLYKPSDCFNHIAPMVATKHDAQKLIKPIMEYSHNLTKCRRHIMAKSFNESSTITSAICNGKCDVCDNSNSDSYKPIDITSDAILINKIIQKTVNKHKKNTLSMCQLVDVWRGSSSNIQCKKLINDLNINKMKSYTKVECEYIIGELFVMGYLNIDTRFTTWSAVCIFIPGPRSFTLTEIYCKRNNTKIIINLPALGKRKRNKLKSQKENKKKKRSKSAVNSNNNNSNNNMKNYSNLSSQSQSQSQNEDMLSFGGWKSTKRIASENGKRGKKRKRNENINNDSETVVDLCSSDSDSDKDNENNNKIKRKKSSNWELNDSDDDEFAFDFAEDCKKKKKKKKNKKKKSKKKRLSDDDDDDVQEIEPPKRKKRKLSKKTVAKKAKIKNKKIKHENDNVNENVNENDINEEISNIYVEYGDIDCVPDEYKDDSLEYKMYTELHIWNQTHGCVLMNENVKEILNNLQHVLSEEEFEIERIIGHRVWLKIGKELLKEIRRVRNEYDTYNKQNNNNICKQYNNNVVINNNNNNNNNGNNNINKQLQRNEYDIYNKQYNNDIVMINNNNNNNNGTNNKQIQRIPMKIADNLKNRNNKSPALVSSFCPASLVNNGNVNINNEDRPPNRQRRNSAPSQNINIGRMNNVKKKNNVMIHQSTIHQKLLSTTVISNSNNNNNNNNNINDNGFEYPDSSEEEISTPQSSTESPLLIRRKQQNKKSISSRTAKLKLNFQ